MEQKLGLIAELCVCVCVLVWAKSNETKIPGQNGKNQTKESLLLYPNAWVCMRVRKIKRQWQQVMEKKVSEGKANINGAQGAKRSPTAATQNSNSWLNLNWFEFPQLAQGQPLCTSFFSYHSKCG